jgi:TonB family protein
LLDDRMPYKFPADQRNWYLPCLSGTVHLIAKIERTGKSVDLGSFPSSSRKRIERIVGEIQRHWRSGREGVRHSASDYERKRPPWLLDITNAVAFDRHRGSRGRFLGLQGRGLFQLKLDLKTGNVTRVTVLRSTGVAELDTSAVAALSRWRWKPGKWKEIEMAVAFTRP